METLFLFPTVGMELLLIKISTGQTTGTYLLDYINLYDAAYSRNDIRYKNDGTTEYYDDQNRINVIDKHNFDFSSHSFTVTKAETNTESIIISPNLKNLAIYSADKVMDLSDRRPIHLLLSSGSNLCRHKSSFFDSR